MKSIARWIVFANFWVSIGAASMGLLTHFLLLEEKPTPSSLTPIWILFFGTLFTYNLCVFYTQEATSEKFEFILKKKHVLQILFFWSALMLLPTPFFLKLNQFWFLVHLAAISFFYTVPIHLELPSGTLFSIRAWRNVPYLKIFLIAYVWASATVIFPMLGDELIIKDERTVSLFLERFLFVMAITIPFDIRDQENDSKRGLPTLVGKLGTKISKALGLILLLACLWIVHTYFYSQLLVFGIIYFISALFVLMSTKRQSEWYFTAFIDGLFVLELVLYWLSLYL